MENNYTRGTSVAGLFYPSGKKELKDLIYSYFENIEVPDSIGIPKAVVCPHAGYVYSGQVAAYSYKTIMKNWDNLSGKTFVILCPSHYVNFDKVAIGIYDKLSTPLGDLSVNKDLGRKILHEHKDYFIEDNSIFENEHSLEVQLPFLKYIAGKQDIKVLPIIFGLTDIERIGKIMTDLYERYNLFFIVSSDLSHYKDYLHALEIDRKSLDSFLTMDSLIISEKADACGIHPWLTLNEIAKMKLWEPKLLIYLNSGDTMGDKERVVGYSSFVYI